MKRILDCLDRKWFGRISCALIAAYCVAAWWPFALLPRNHVSWIPERPGLSFTATAIARDSERLPFSRTNLAPEKAANFTVELWVEAGRESRRGLFHLLTVHDGRLPSSFALCQWRQEFLLRVPGRNLLRREGQKTEVGVSGALQAGTERFITVSGSEAGTDFYLDGVSAGHFPEFIVNAEAFAGRIIVANAANGRYPWTGRLFGLAIFDRPLDAAKVEQHHALWTVGRAREIASEPGVMALYLFDEGSGLRAKDLSGNGHHLEIPAIYSAPQKEFLLPPWRDLVANRPNYLDITVNILGFLPFGFCYFLYRSSSARGSKLINLLIVVLVGAVVSLGLETVQVWLGNRVSSMTDLICNTVGTLLGALPAFALRLIVHCDTPKSDPP